MIFTDLGTIVTVALIIMETFVKLAHGFRIIGAHERKLKVFNSKEVGEVKEGADCYSAKKLSKQCNG